MAVVLWDGSGVPAVEGYLGGYQVATVCKEANSIFRHVDIV